MKRIVPSTAALLLATSIAGAQITQIIDSSGDGSGNALNGPQAVALGPSGNIYVIGPSA